MENKDNTVYTGKVIFFSPRKGWGFVQWEKDGEPQKDLFCYYSDIVCDGFKTLKKDQSVSFQLGLNHRQQLKAINVTVND